MRWFYTKEITNSTATICGDEARHLSLVLRAKVRDEIVCFNGLGKVCECKIESISKTCVQCSVMKVKEYEQKSSQLVLAAAAIKGERQVTMIRQAVELGVTKIVLLETERSEVKLRAEKSDKYERQIVACCKQCQRPYMPKIEFDEIKNYVSKCNDFCIIYGKIGEKHTVFDVDFGKVEKSNVAVLIGPEGGLTAGEQKLLDASGAIGVSLGQNILRADTAATMLVSLVKTIKKW